MSDLSLTLDQLPAFFEARAKAIEHIDLTPQMRVAGLSLVLGDVRGLFDRGESPDGESWLPLKRARRRNKAVGTVGLPLRDTGVLMASVTVAGAPGSIFDVGPSWLTVGTNLKSKKGAPYPYFHQYGTRTIPARPFLGFTPKTIDRIDQILTAAVVAAMTP
jgi:phage gpG-like protein